ncbi:MAG: hypothetical protein IJ220_07915 [Clostridia bacterium]|nr:hypothetical protein [Clostridia bacterium]
MKKIENEILVKLSNEIKPKDKIILWIMKRYTYNIYRIGFNDGFSFKYKNKN